MRLGQRLLTFAAIVAMAGVAAAAAPNSGPYVSDTSHDYFGYYFPQKPLPSILTRWTLDSINIEPPNDFRYFETGREDPDLPGEPVKPFTIDLIEAHPSPNTTAAEIEVVPDSYRLVGNTVSFAGTDSVVGRVTFEGVFTPLFMKQIATKAGPPRGYTVVLTGTLTVGTAKFPLRLWWDDGGDD
jgi:hypothetical protein